MPGSVSVIVPAYEAAHSLDACLDSVAAQTHPPLEVLVVDDGSSDATAAVARRRAPGVSLISQTHLGPGAARNAGLARARGDYVAFLDADDRWTPGFLAATVAFLEAHPEAVAVNTGGRTRLANGRERPLPADPEAARAAGLLPAFYDFWARYDHVRTGTVLLRRDVLIRAGGQREDLRISQDLEYWGYIATFGPWGFLPEPLWVGTSREHARRRGRQQKYRERRAMTPDIAAWERRIAPRLSPEQRVPFERVRGRVAAGFLHALALAGQAARAQTLLRDYGSTMPANRVVRILRAADRAGDLAWVAAVLLLRVWEWSQDRG